MLAELAVILTVEKCEELEKTITLHYKESSLWLKNHHLLVLMFSSYMIIFHRARVENQLDLMIDQFFNSSHFSIAILAPST